MGDFDTGEFRNVPKVIWLKGAELGQARSRPPECSWLVTLVKEEGEDKGKATKRRTTGGNGSAEQRWKTEGRMGVRPCPGVSSCAEVGGGLRCGQQVLGRCGGKVLAWCTCPGRVRAALLSSSFL